MGNKTEGTMDPERANSPSDPSEVDVANGMTDPVFGDLTNDGPNYRNVSQQHVLSSDYLGTQHVCRSAGLA
jgi:hypothetical protein